MHPNAIQPGDLIEVQIDGITFTATVESKNPKVVGISPTNPVVYPQRFCDYSQVLRVVERPVDEETAA